MYDIDGSSNTAIGASALKSNTIGDRNVGIGCRAGMNATTSDGNIFISNEGVAGDAGKMKIGTQGTQTQTFIAGILNTGISGVHPVYVDTNGQLGQTTSSRRFKGQIADMGETSEGLLELRPVTFKYRKEPTAGEQPLSSGSSPRRWPR